MPKFNTYNIDLVASKIDPIYIPYIEDIKKHTASYLFKSLCPAFKNNYSFGKNVAKIKRIEKHLTTILEIIEDRDNTDFSNFLKLYAKELNLRYGISSEGSTIYKIDYIYWKSILENMKFKLHWASMEKKRIKSKDIFNPLERTQFITEIGKIYHRVTGKNPPRPNGVDNLTTDFIELIRNIISAVEWKEENLKEEFQNFKKEFPESSLDRTIREISWKDHLCGQKDKK